MMPVHPFKNQLQQRLPQELLESAPQQTMGGWLTATSNLLREELEARWRETQSADKKNSARRVYYFSMEFLLGRSLLNAADALEVTSGIREVMQEQAVDWNVLVNEEPDPGLGNGGLGRLAACFLDSMATLGIPAWGYGIRYEYGMFSQQIRDGVQVEAPDNWLKKGHPWEMARGHVHYPIRFGGWVDHSGFQNGAGPRWVPAETAHAGAYDLVIPGHATHRVATLRLWKASSEETIDLSAFARGDYHQAASAKYRHENISWVLYPDDSTPAGRELRLRQEYFFVSASLQDILARHLREYGELENLAEKVAVHLNDTHPAIAPAELMRLLVDEHRWPWEKAWAQCEQIFSYTNHTLMPEALETWPVALFQYLLPRHLEIIHEINRRFLDLVGRVFPADVVLQERLSLIDGQGDPRVRMAHLAIVASHQINGVSALHSRLMVETIFADFAKVWPERFTNVTNGITPRRWLAQANPSLSALLDQRLPGDWRVHLEKLRDIEGYASDAAWQREFVAAKQANKARLAQYIQEKLGISVRLDSLFDVHIKRIHEYKRQLLNILHVVARYQAMLQNPEQDWQPRTVIFAGKAASAYYTAKQIIRLIHDVARVVNQDLRLRDRLKVVFLPNYSVSLAELIIPAAELSEQISTAGTEASGTGNMKFALNGALTIGTYDGANIEISEAVGMDNIFIFGHRAEGIEAMRQQGYAPKRFYDHDPQLKAVMDAVYNGEFSPEEPARYHALMESLWQSDRYFLLADFAAYVSAQAEVDRTYRDPSSWWRKSIINVAHMGWFSTDRTIREYATKIWGLTLGSPE